MPLEKQNKRKTQKRKKKIHGKRRRGKKREKRQIRQRRKKIKRCSLLDRYLCKTSEEKMIDIQKCSWWQQYDVCHLSSVCRC